MESAVNYAIRRILEEIDRGILSDAFTECGQFSLGSMGVSLERQIANIVLDKSVFKDIALISSKEESISLEGLPVEYINDSYAKIHIPASRRGGRRIMEVYRVEYSSTQSSFRHQIERQEAHDVALSDLVLAGISAMPDTSTSRVDVIAPNTIAISDINRYGYRKAIVSLEIDNNLSHIPTKAYDDFGTLCVAKAQQLIYTRIMQEIGVGKIVRGKNLDVYQSQIERYADSGQTYRDLIKKWRHIESYFDPARKLKHIRARTGRP